MKTRSNLNDDKPLFTKWGSNDERIIVGAIQQKFREIANELDFIQDNGEGLNPARPHSLRSAFRSRLTGKMNDILIEFLMGHEIGEAKRAYINLPDDELRDIYARFENELSIEKTSKDVLAEKIERTRETDEKTKQKIEKLESIINSLSECIKKRGKENTELHKKYKKLEAMFGELSHNVDLFARWTNARALIHSAF